MNMRTNHDATMRSWLVLIVITFMSITILLQDASANQRKVLAEIFTNIGCPVTGSWIPIADRTLREFDADEYVQITFHTWWPGLDPWYIDNFNRHLPGVDDIITRVAYYGYNQFMGVPSYFFDGHRIGGRVHQGDTRDGFARQIREYVAERLDIETPIRLEIEGEVEEMNLNFRVRVYSDENLSNLILFMALCERYAHIRGFPSGQTDFYDNVLDMIPDANGHAFRIPEGQDASFDFEASLDVGWRENPLHNLSLVAWVQDEEREVLQVEEFVLGQQEPTVLVVDATADPQVGETMFEAFGIGVLPIADRWVRDEAGEISADDMTGYEAIFWHSFNCEESIITPDEEDGLIEYLDNGGTLIVSSPYLGQDIGDGLLYQRYLSVRQDEEDVELYLVRGANDIPAFEGARIHLGGDGGAGRPNITPGLTPFNEAAAVMYYEDDGEHNGIAGVQHITDRYRTLTLAFPIESIDGVEETMDQREFIALICNWMTDAQAIPVESQASIYSYRLDPAYPNPFNSMTNISYNLPVAARVSLQVYNTTGRSIALLIENVQSAGCHTAIWNCVSDPAGIYFVVMKAGDFRAVRKVVLTQ